MLPAPPLCCLQVRDFGLVFDALTHFEESLLAAKMAQMGDEEPPEQVRRGHFLASCT